MRTAHRAIAVLAAAGAVALAVASLAPVSAHDAGAQHDWNAHLLPLAKDSFFTKAQSRMRFLEGCEPGTVAAAARVDPAELTDSFVDVSTLASGRAYNCLGDGISVRREGVGEYFWVVDNETGSTLEDLVITPVVMGDGNLGHVSFGGIPGGAVDFFMSAYTITSDSDLLVRSKFDPPVIGFLLEIAG